MLFFPSVFRFVWIVLELCPSVWSQNHFLKSSKINKLKSHRNEKNRHKIQFESWTFVACMRFSSRLEFREVTSSALQIIISSAHSTLEIYHMLFYILFISFSAQSLIRQLSFYLFRLLNSCLVNNIVHIGNTVHHALRMPWNGFTFHITNNQNTQLYFNNRKV